MRHRERQEWMGLLERERAEHRVEIAKLLDRIQHPEVRQVEPGEVVQYDLPTDDAELAQVGQIVYGPSENGASDA